MTVTDMHSLLHDLEILEVNCSKMSFYFRKKIKVIMHVNILLPV